MSKPSVWIFVVDSRNNQDLSDLDHFDEILWGANPNTRKGDIVLMYRTAPYSDIAYVFSATSNPRQTKPDDRADTKHVIQLGDKSRLNNPITLKEIRESSDLSNWSFARYQRGIMRHSKDIKEEGFWISLRALVISRNPMLSVVLGRLERSRATGSKGSRFLRQANSARKPARQMRVFISYASPDLRRVRGLYRELRQKSGLDLWFDRESLVPGDDWQYEITRAIRSCDIVVICLSSRSVRRRGFAQKEIRWALKKADEQPEKTTCIIPVKLEACEIPKRLAHAQCAELFNRKGHNRHEAFKRLVAGLRKRASFFEETGTK